MRLFHIVIALLLASVTCANNFTTVLMVPTVFVDNSGPGVSVQGDAATTRFHHPYDVSVSFDKQWVWIAESYAGLTRMSMLNGSTEKMATLAESGNNQPSGVDAHGQDGDVYFTTWPNTYKYDAQLDQTTQFADFGQVDVERCTRPNGQQWVFIAQQTEIRAYDLLGNRIPGWQLGGVFSVDPAEIGQVGTGVIFNTQSFSLSPDCTQMALANGWGTNKVFIVDIDTQTLTHIFGDGTAASVDGKGTAAQFNAPKGVSWSSTGYTIVVNEGNTHLRFIDVASQQVTTSLDELPTSIVMELDTVGQEGNLVVCYLHGVSVLSVPRLSAVAELTVRVNSLEDALEDCLNTPESSASLAGMNRWCSLRNQLTVPTSP